MPVILQQQSQALRRVSIVIRNENSPRRRSDHTGLRRQRRGISAFNQYRQPHDKFAPAPPPVAPNGNSPAVQLDQPLHDREPNSQSATCPFQRLINLLKHFENTVDLVWRDTDARVLDRNGCVAALSLDGNGNSAPI